MNGETKKETDDNDPEREGQSDPAPDHEEGSSDQAGEAREKVIRLGTLIVLHPSKPHTSAAEEFEF